MVLERALAARIEAVFIHVGHAAFVEGDRRLGGERELAQRLGIGHIESVAFEVLGHIPCGLDLVPKLPVEFVLQLERVELELEFFGKLLMELLVVLILILEGRRHGGYWRNRREISRRRQRGLRSDGRPRRPRRRVRLPGNPSRRGHVFGRHLGWSRPRPRSRRRHWGRWRSLGRRARYDHGTCGNQRASHYKCSAIGHCSISF